MTSDAEPLVLPDGGEVFREWAIGQPAITADVDQRVSIALAGDLPAIRHSVVSDAAGSYDEGMPLILVECWGAGGGAADDGTASRVARIVAALATGSAADGFYAAIESGPYSSPDPTSGRPRWIVTVRLLTFPDPPA